MYKFLERVSEEERERFKCSNTCAYEHAEKDSDAKYCFKPGKLESSCKEAGTTAVFSTTTATTTMSKCPEVGVSCINPDGSNVIGIIESSSMLNCSKNIIIKRWEIEAFIVFFQR